DAFHRTARTGLTQVNQSGCSGMVAVVANVTAGDSRLFSNLLSINRTGDASGFQSLEGLEDGNLLVVPRQIVVTVDTVATTALGLGSRFGRRLLGSLLYRFGGSRSLLGRLFLGSLWDFRSGRRAAVIGLVKNS